MEGWGSGAYCGRECLREAGRSLDAGEEGGDEDGVESVVCEAAELNVFVSSTVTRPCLVRRQ